VTQVRPPLRREAHSRRASAQVRRRRVLVGGAAVLVVVGVVVAVWSGSSKPRATAPATHPGGGPAQRITRGIPAAEAGLLPWTLDQPLSREVVLPSVGTTVTVLGGLSSSQQTLGRVFTLDTATGGITTSGALAAGVHDAAGVRLGPSDLVLGGGSPNTVAGTQRFTTPSGTGTAVGQLRRPRSDAVGVTIGRTGYVVGGYDGTNADPEVLATKDGATFSVVADLKVPVRYPAVAALDGKIYLFGGEAVEGAAKGRAVTAIQMVDPSSHAATVVGHMPSPVAGAAAFVLGGHLYVAGGTSGAGGAVATGPAVGDIWAFDPTKAKVLRAGTLPAPVSFAGTTVVGSRAWIVGGENQGNVLSQVEMVTPNTRFGTAGAPGAGSPFFGAELLVADRGNDRLLLLNPRDQTIWTYPSSYAAPPPGGFYFPDDAFFIDKGTEIISNQENNDTIVIISFPSGKVLWQYGHPRVASSSPGYLNTPDDAYLLKNGQVTVADANNCRVLFITTAGTVASQVGTTGVCAHNPPNDLASPNGDTPLADGNVLISEINGSWVSEYTPTGHLVWTVHLPIGYPSDPQQIGPDLYLVSDYSHPGGIVEFTREGKIVYRYQPASGPGELNKPSLTELLPSGVFLSNDDYRNRMVAIDPATQSLVWQYGVTDTPGTAPGFLNIPDGFDLLLPNGTTPTHPTTQ